MQDLRLTHYVSHDSVGENNELVNELIGTKRARQIIVRRIYPQVATVDPCELTKRIEELLHPDSVPAACDVGPNNLVRAAVHFNATEGLPLTGFAPPIGL